MTPIDANVVKKTFDTISRMAARRTTVERMRDESIDELHRLCGIYTMPEVAGRILDVVGWRKDADLSDVRLLEPAAGNGEFVAQAGQRLVASYRSRGIEPKIGRLREKIVAFELQPHAAADARRRITAALGEMGIHHKTAAACGAAWIRNADFLLADIPEATFTHVVGNPPYIRWSKIPGVLKSIYEDRLPREMTGGDLFLPFLDRSFTLLRASGECGFLCSDRWLYMAFAERFRKKWLRMLDIRSNESVISADVFTRRVDAYPTILIASKRKTRKVGRHVGGRRTGRTLDELGYVIKAGPALGHTPAFVIQPGENDIESGLLHRWIDSSEVLEGSIKWAGRHVIAMFNDDGNLLELNRFPKLKYRMRRFSAELKRRSIVRNGAPWYRTIDRVRAVDWLRPKLLVPELAKIPRIAIDRSGAIPSHGIYAIFTPHDCVEDLYERLSDGGLARALNGISPKLKGGYVRCYRRFLSKVRI